MQGREGDPVSLTWIKVFKLSSRWAVLVNPFALSSLGPAYRLTIWHSYLYSKLSKLKSSVKTHQMEQTVTNTDRIPLDNGSGDLSKKVKLKIQRIISVYCNLIVWWQKGSLYNTPSRQILTILFDRLIN